MPLSDRFLFEVEGLSATLRVVSINARSRSSTSRSRLRSTPALGERGGGGES